LIVEDALRAFDLSRGPLVRAALLRLVAEPGEERHVALLNLHHIVSDGWSMGVLVGEVTELYTALLTGRAPMLPRLAVQYADYAAWQRSWLRGEVLEAHRDHGRRALAGAREFLALPLDRPRPAVQTYRG